jgi:hypothetical protein
MEDEAGKRGGVGAKGPKPEASGQATVGIRGMPTWEEMRWDRIQPAGILQMYPEERRGNIK